MRAHHGPQCAEDEGRSPGVVGCGYAAQGGARKGHSGPRTVYTERWAAVDCGQRVRQTGSSNWSALRLG